ncbi:35222_t:CDS:1, partial [Racocetra persica]
AISRTEVTAWPSEGSAETIEVSGHQEAQDPMTDMATRMKAYFDTAIQAATTSIMQNMQQFINQQAETQQEWNAQLIATINQRPTHVEQTNQRDDAHNALGIHPTSQQNEQGATNTRRDT